MIEAEGVRALALQGVSLRAARGETHAVLGPSGSGKSTLLRVLCGLEPPREGTVRVDGARLDALATRRRIGYVQQQPGLLRGSALANVTLPLRARGIRDDAPARAALARLGVAPQARSVNLSGGEAQRVALARAIVTSPDALLLDEPTNQLDPEGTRLVEAIVREQAARGAAIVLVTHSIPQARRLAQCVAFLEAGRVVQSGPTAAVFADPAPRLRAFLDVA